MKKLLAIFTINMLISHGLYAMEEQEQHLRHRVAGAAASENQEHTAQGDNDQRDNLRCGEVLCGSACAVATWYVMMEVLKMSIDDKIKKQNGMNGWPE